MLLPLLRDLCVGVLHAFPCAHLLMAAGTCYRRSERRLLGLLFEMHLPGLLALWPICRRHASSLKRERERESSSTQHQISAAGSTAEVPIIYFVAPSRVRWAKHIEAQQRGTELSQLLLSSTVLKQLK